MLLFHIAGPTHMVRLDKGKIHDERNEISTTLRARYCQRGAARGNLPFVGYLLSSMDGHGQRCVFPEGRKVIYVGFLPASSTVM